MSFGEAILLMTNADQRYLLFIHNRLKFAGATEDFWTPGNPLSSAINPEILGHQLQHASPSK